MNKTLLLIMCDFLLLNLLALTRWEKAEPPSQQNVTAVKQAEAAAPMVNADMVELMRVSLEDEKASREQLASQLSNTQQTLSQREQSVSQLTQQKTQLEGALNTTTANAKELEKKYSDATNEAFLTKEQLAKLQQELEARKAEAERQAAALAELDRRNSEARQNIESLKIKVGVAEQEKALLSQNLTEAKQQVEVERTERLKVQEQTVQLTQNVGQLAEKSGELTKEVRDNRPVNPNAIFSDFLANRVTTSITTRRPGLFSPTVKEKTSQTILVTDGQQTYALMHVNDTPFFLSFENPPDFELISGKTDRNGVGTGFKELRFLTVDPRVIVAPVDDAIASRMGVKIYKLATDVFKASEALLVRADDGKYGETPFRIDAANPGYVQVDNRIVTRLFGEFAPKSGDLMFSKQGDLIGIMVNNGYCAVLSSFRASQTLKAGDNVAQPKTGPVFSSLASRLQSLPPKLQ